MEHKGFKHLIETLVPGSDIPPRSMFATKEIRDLCLQSNEIIRADLKATEYISAASNWWMSPDFNHYFSLTVTFISSDWKVETRNLACRQLNANYNKDNVRHLLGEILKEFDIPMEKLVSMTTDRSAEFVEAEKDLRIHHISCFVDVVNSFIQEIIGLKGEIKGNRTILPEFLYVN